MKQLVLLLILIGPLSAMAQASGKQQPTRQNPRTTVLSFEDELIQGDASSPDLFVILKNKNLNFGKLLKLRENFIPEMRQTRQDVHGSRD